MSTESFDALVREIGMLRTQCEEFRVRNETLQYHLDRERRAVRELERELQEYAAGSSVRVPNFSRPEYDPPPPLGWGKGKDE
jgi:chromosomal replication initiation ATPase DnaA